MTGRALPNAILVPVDFSASSLRALEYAAAWCPPDGDITALHVIDNGLAARLEDLGLVPQAETMKKLRARGEAQFARLAQERGETFNPLVVEGEPVVEILKLARDLDVDMIVIGRQGYGAGMAELLFGSTAEKVLRGAGCPVLCVS